MLARVASAFLALVTSIGIARVYGAAAVGLVAVASTYMAIASIFTLFGTRTSILRLIPENISKYSVSSAHAVYRRVRAMVIVASLGVAAVLVFGAKLIATSVLRQPEMASIVVIVGIFAPMHAIAMLTTEATRGLQMVLRFAIMSVLPSLAMLIAFIGSAAIGASALEEVVKAQLGAWVIVAICGTFIVKTEFDRRSSARQIVTQISSLKLFQLSFPMMLTASMHLIVSQMSLLTLSAQEEPEIVGFYSVAVRLSMITSYILISINSIAAPKFSQLYHCGSMEELFRVAKKSTRLVFWLTFPIVIFLIVFGRGVLVLGYGPEFGGAYWALVLLAVGQLINAIAGSTNYFMSMTDNHLVLRNIMAMAALVCVGLNFILIPAYGIIGAGAATMITVVFWNVAILYFMKSKFGKTTGYFPLVAPV